MQVVEKENSDTAIEYVNFGHVFKNKDSYCLCLSGTSLTNSVLVARLSDGRTFELPYRTMVQVVKGKFIEE